MQPFSKLRQLAIASEKFHWLRLLIWTVGILLLISLSLADFMSLLGHYKYNNTTTQTTVIKNENIPRPNLTVCFPYPSGALRTISAWIERRNGSCLECEAMAENSWDVWNRINLDPSNFRWNHSLLAAALIKKLVDDGDVTWSRSLEFNRSNFNWNEAIFDAVWIYFGCLVYDDIGFTSRHVDRSSKFCRGFDFFDIRPLSSSLTDFLYDRLLDFVGIYLNISIGIKEGHPIADDLRKRKHFVAIKGDRLCLPLHSDTVFEKFSFVPFTFDNTTPPPPWIRSPADMIDRFLVFSDYSILYTVVQAFTAIYPTGKRFQTRQLEDVSVAYSLDARVIETRSDIACDSSGSSFKTCFVEKQLRKAVKYCDCVPFIFRYRYTADESRSPKLPYCNQTYYIKCQAKLQASLIQHEQECRNPCENLFYNWKQVGKSWDDENSWEQTFTIKIFSVTEPFMEFRITAKDTEEQFLSQVMGMFSFYLGFSGVGVCAFLVVCMDHIRRWWLQRRGAVGHVHMDLVQGRADCYVTNADLHRTIEKLRAEMDVVLLQYQKKM